MNQNKLIEFLKSLVSSLYIYLLAFFLVFITYNIIYGGELSFTNNLKIALTSLNPFNKNAINFGIGILAIIYYFTHKRRRSMNLKYAVLIVTILVTLSYIVLPFFDRPSSFRIFM